MLRVIVILFKNSVYAVSLKKSGEIIPRFFIFSHIFFILRQLNLGYNRTSVSLAIFNLTSIIYILKDGTNEEN